MLPDKKCPHGNGWLYFHEWHPRPKQIPTAGVTLDSLWQMRSLTQSLAKKKNIFHQASTLQQPLCIAESYWLLSLDSSHAGFTTQIWFYKAEFGLVKNMILLKRCSFIRSRPNMANVKGTLVLEEQRLTVMTSVTSLAYGFAQVSSRQHDHQWSYRTMYSEM